MRPCLETYALAAIELSIDKGEFLAISGPSGSGKSNLLSILGLLDTPSGGNYRLNGKGVETLSAKERATVRNRQIGFIFQSFNLIGELNVFENVALPLTYQNVARPEIRMRVERALDDVGMSHRSKHRPDQLSGGQQQRVAVARAIVTRPAMLLADEPTGNLDSADGAAVMDMLQTLNDGGSTICMVTHDPRYARSAARTVHLFDRRIVDDASEGARWAG